MIRKIIRHIFQLGLLGYHFPSEFAIRTCIQWRFLQYEHATISFLKDQLKSGHVFVDIGAHIGYFASFASSRVGNKGTVIAFEPHPDNYKLLVRNLSNLPQVKCLPYAVSDTNGQTMLYQCPTNSSSHSLSSLPNAQNTISVKKVMIDTWAKENMLSKMDVVLIDVEGHELAVLNGMKEIINNNPSITIIMEYCPKNLMLSGTPKEKLISKVLSMKLKITLALGQNKCYSITDCSSVSLLSDQFDSIIQKEITIERKDYINIVLKK